MHFKILLSIFRILTTWKFIEENINPMTSDMCRVQCVPPMTSDMCRVQCVPPMTSDMCRVQCVPPMTSDMCRVQCVPPMTSDMCRVQCVSPMTSDMCRVQCVPWSNTNALHTINTSVLGSHCMLAHADELSHLHAN